MLLLASALRGIRRLLIAATAVVLAAIMWTMVLRFAAAPAQIELSGFLWALGTPLLRPFDSLAQSTTFSNGGTFSWTSLAALVAYTLLGAVISWLLAWAAEGLMAVAVARLGPSLEELEARAPRRPTGHTLDEGGFTTRRDESQAVRSKF